MAYTAIDKSSDYFDIKLYSGNGSTQTIAGLDLQPDWTWIKNRNAGEHHVLTDAVRGANKQLNTNRVNVQRTLTTQLTAFTSDGFSVGAGSEVNNGSAIYVSWNWKAGTSFTNDASGTGIGSIDSNGSVSTTSGFSIVKWTGTGATGTIAHGLGAIPRMIIVKSLANATAWMVQHASIGNAKEIYLNNNSGAGNSTAWNSTTPTSTVFSVTGGAGDGVNASGDYIGFCFTDVQGFLKINSYVGNGNANGTFIYTGFKPAFVLYKSITGDDWFISDNKRLGYNPDNNYLRPSLATEEADPPDRINLFSNGFKMTTNDDGANGSGTTYIYMAFAESPFVSSTGIPTTAR